MKPSWDNAPKFANWLAQDGDGDWYWYENKPDHNERHNSWDTNGGEVAFVGREDTGGKIEPRP